MKSFNKAILPIILLFGHHSSDLIYGDQTISLPSLDIQLQVNEKEQENKERLNQLFNLYWDWLMLDNPEDASYLGYPCSHSEWSDLSEKAFTKRENFFSQSLETLNSIDISKLCLDDKISAQIFGRTLKESLAEIKFGSHYLAISQMDGPHHTIPLIIDLMPHQTIEDYQEILSRLDLIPNLIEQIIDLLRKGIELGITPPQITLKKVPQQILNQIVDNPADSSLLKKFYLFPSSFDEETQIKLLSKAHEIYQQAVSPSLIKLYEYLIEEYIPNCRQETAFTHLPNGQNWYTFLVQSYTTTSLTPEEIHAIGIKEVTRIHDEMIEIIRSTGFEGSFDQFLEFIKTDPQFFYSNRNELLEGYRELTRSIAEKLPILFSELPSLPFEVIPIPTYSEESQIAAYYCAGSITNQRPGYFFINTSYPEERPKWEMEPLALHEAVPGHHMQISLAQELQHLPEFRKNANFTAYIEGWGLYAESLGSELGLYQTPYSMLGKLSYEMLRAIRLVVDTGMHTMGWSRERAIAYFKQHVGMSDHEIETEVDRYLVMPGQALAYKIGELKIQEMRRLAKEQLGEEFDIREFHRTWLKHGTVPLNVAEERVMEWIHNQQKEKF